MGATGAAGAVGATGVTGATGTAGAQGPSTAINATAVATGTFFPVFVAAAGSNQTPSVRTASTAFSYDAATNILTVTATSATTAGTVTTAAQPNITSVGTMSAATITTLTTAGITKSGTNGTGNIGQSNNAFNTVFAKATSAQYADLAEIYESDSEYDPGTVVIFGGSHEITVSTIDHDTRVAGVVSTNPAYIMNSEAAGLPVALTGRVPCLVQGPVEKGSVLAAGPEAGVAVKLDNTRYLPGCVIGKALERISTDEIKLIEVVVGRF